MSEQHHPDCECDECCSDFLSRAICQVEQSRPVTQLVVIRPERLSSLEAAEAERNRLRAELATCKQQLQVAERDLAAELKTVTEAGEYWARQYDSVNNDRLAHLQRIEALERDLAAERERMRVTDEARDRSEFIRNAAHAELTEAGIPERLPDTPEYRIALSERIKELVLRRDAAEQARAAERERANAEAAIALENRHLVDQFGDVAREAIARADAAEERAAQAEASVARLLVELQARCGDTDDVSMVLNSVMAGQELLEAAEEMALVLGEVCKYGDSYRGVHYVNAKKALARWSAVQHG